MAGVIFYCAYKVACTIVASSHNGYEIRSDSLRPGLHIPHSAVVLLNTTRDVRLYDVFVIYIEFIISRLWSFACICCIRLRRLFTLTLARVCSVLRRQRPFLPFRKV